MTCATVVSTTSYLDSKRGAALRLPFTSASADPLPDVGGAGARLAGVEGLTKGLRDIVKQGNAVKEALVRCAAPAPAFSSNERINWCPCRCRGSSVSAKKICSCGLLFFVS